MKKEFDFDDIGKRTPYLTPEHYFEEMQDKVIMAVKKAEFNLQMQLNSGL